MSRVALIGENSIEYVDRLIDIWNSGNCVVLIDWRIPLQASIEMMREASVHECYIEKKILDNNVEKISNNIKFLPYEKKNNTAEYLPKDIYNKFKPNYNKNEAIVLYSSGTTGKSKGIILSHFALNTNADAIIDYMKPSEADCIYIAKTLSHSSTLTGELLVALKTHTKIVIAPTIVPPRYIFGNIIKFNITIICLNPTLLSMLADEMERVNYNISSLRTVYVSGSILNEKIYTKAHDIFKSIPIYNVYGLSEAGPRVTAQCADCCKNNSVGKPIKGIDIQIVDDAGNLLNQGERGIVCVNTPSIFIGYVSGEETCQPLCENWLNTGDIGYIDNNGELHIMSRIDDMINIYAHKIYTSEIEKTILDTIEIKECIVVKVDYKSSEFIGCLYVGYDISEQEIRNKLKVKLPAYEIPRRFIKCDVIPRTLNGKISKINVRDKIINTLETEL